MPVSFFGRFLLERRAITREALLDTLEFQKACNKTIAQMAVEKGWVAPDRAAAIAEQQKQAGNKFEDIAGDEGVLTKPQVAELLRTQMKEWVFFSDAVVRRGHLSRRQLEQRLLEFRREQDAWDGDGVEGLEGMPHSDSVDTFLAVTTGMFKQMVGEDASVVSVSMGPLPTEGYGYIVTQRIRGDRDFIYGLALPSALALFISARTAPGGVEGGLGMDMESIAEFVNIIVGNGCARLSIRGLKVEADPVVITRKGEERTDLEGACVIAKMTSENCNFSVVMHFGADFGTG